MDERVLFLLEDRRQAQFATQIFSAISVSLTIVEKIEDLCSEIEKGTGAVVITQNSLTEQGRQSLLHVLEKQPSWSDIPVILLMPSRDKKTGRHYADLLPTDVTLLDAPVRVRTLLSVVQTAVKSRRRQYVVRDLIASLEKAQAQEREARNIAEAASRAKSEFLAGMTHDLRTPLSGVIGMLSLALDMDIDDDAKYYLQMADRSAHSLLKLVNDILDFSRAEAGKMVIERKPFSVREAVRAAVEAVSVQAIQKGLRLRIEFAGNLPEQVVGDETRLRQVLVNLLGNAVKFTEQGNVDVSVSRQEGGELLLFSVSDTGIGIRPEKLDEIFGRYIQADESIPTRYGGSGIGLALSNELVEKMGGWMRVESKVDEGSTFSFVLPLPQA